MRQGARIAVGVLFSLLLLAIVSSCGFPLPRPAPKRPTLGLTPLPAVGSITLVPGGLLRLPTPSPTRAIVQEHLAGVRVSLYAGSGQRGALDGPSREARFAEPIALAMEPNGALLVAELSSGRIRLISADGFVHTWIGTPDDTNGSEVDPTSPLYHPTDLAIRDGGALLAVDGQQRLVSLVPGHEIELLAGGARGFRDGMASQAAFDQLWGLAVDPSGRVYLADSANHRIRVLDRDGKVRTVAGSGITGHADGPAQKAMFAYPRGLAFTPDGRLCIADSGGLDAREVAKANIRILSPDGQVMTLAGGSKSGYVDGPPEQARFGSPLLGIDVDAAGNIYVADPSNHVVRIVTPDGRVRTLAGSGHYGLAEGSGSEAQLGLPADVLWDGHNGLYVADYGQHVIWYISWGQ